MSRTRSTSWCGTSRRTEAGTPVSGEKAPASTTDVLSHGRSHAPVARSTTVEAARGRGPGLEPEEAVAHRPGVQRQMDTHARRQGSAAGTGGEQDGPCPDRSGVRPHSDHPGTRGEQVRGTCPQEAQARSGVLDHGGGHVAHRQPACVGLVHGVFVGDRVQPGEACADLVGGEDLGLVPRFQERRHPGECRLTFTGREEGEAAPASYGGPAAVPSALPVDGQSGGREVLVAGGRGEGADETAGDTCGASGDAGLVDHDHAEAAWPSAARPWPDR